MQATVAAIVPMRHNSERIPGKNYRLFAGRPLYHHIIRSLLRCELINKVVIDTDSPTIMEDAAKNFPSVLVLERPAHLRSGSTAMNDVLLHTIREVKADYYFQTHSTNPLLKSETITTAIQTFLRQAGMYDSLFSVTRWQTRLWDSLARAVNHNPAILLRTQDLPPIYEENSCMYIFSREILESHHNRIGKRPILFDLEAIEAQDIDEEHNFLIAELLYKHQGGNL